MAGKFTNIIHNVLLLFAVSLAVTVLITAVCGCSIKRYSAPMSHTLVHTATIPVYTHELPRDMKRAVIWAVNTVNEEVFADETCTKLVVVEGAKTFIDGLHFFDDTKITIPQNQCRSPFVWTYSSGKWAGGNFCRQRMDFGWRHAVGPEHYLAMNQLLKMLGLPASVSGPFAASYTANDYKLRKAQETGLFKNSTPMIHFRISEGEKAALQQVYCGK